MKANKFVKKFGWDAAIGLSNEMTGITQDVANYVACWGQSEWDYLQRLVKSCELVQGYGGLNGSRNTLNLLKSSVEIGLYHGVEGVSVENEVPRLKQAIADVESCL